MDIKTKKIDDNTLELSCTRIKTVTKDELEADKEQLLKKIDEVDSYLDALK